MYKARVVLFFEGQKFLSAICLEDKGNRLHVLSSEGREMNINLNRILHVSSYTLDLSRPRDSLLKKLEAICQKQTDFMRQVDVSSLWELLRGEGELFDAAYLSRTIFGETADSDQTASVLRALIDDRTRFKLHGRQFQINTPEQIASIQTKRQAEAQRQRDIEQGSIWLESIMQGNDMPCEREQRFIGLLKEFILFGSDAPEYQLIREMLDQAKITDPKTCFKILVSRGILDEDENLFVPRYQIATQWSRSVLDETDAIAKQYDCLTGRNGARHDLTRLPVFSIDDDSTRDVDDAISFEEHTDYVRIGVHITDVASFITQGSALDREAAKRATSIYLPDGKIPLLPVHLSEELLSLKEGQTRPALSFFINLSQTGELLDTELLLSVIKVSKKLTYADVDSYIETNPLFAHLYRVTATRREKRVQDGALLLPIPELQVTVDQHKQITIGIRKRNAPSQIIVSECMILANYTAALFFKEKGIPVLYRKQTQPRENLASPDTGSLYYLIRQRKLLSRVEIGIEPGPHQGLGLNPYTSVTSPLRKYLDLVTQRQLVSILAGKQPVYGKNDLKTIVSETEPSLTKAAIVEQERERYWVLKFLQSQVGQILKALVIDKRPRGYTILLSDYMLEVNLSVPDGKDLIAGETVGVILEKVDPFNSSLKVSLAAA
jgi:exoribonuclease-2